MAKAVKETTQVPVTTYVEQEKIVLALSMDEAEALNAIISRIGGTPVKSDGKPSVRGLLTDHIGRALRDALGHNNSLSCNNNPDSTNHDDDRGIQSMYIPARTVVL